MLFIWANPNMDVLPQLCLMFRLIFWECCTAWWPKCGRPTVKQMDRSSDTGMIFNLKSIISSHKIWFNYFWWSVSIPPGCLEWRLNYWNPDILQKNCWFGATNMPRHSRGNDFWIVTFKLNITEYILKGKKPNEYCDFYKVSLKRFTI